MIKLRAWHKEFKRYMEVKNIDFDLKVINFKIIHREDDDLIIDEDYVEGTPFDEIVLEQFTGLKDKNGVELWEGDIVKMDGLSYLIKLDDEGGKWCMSLERAWMNYLFLTKKRAPFMKIIGNIHENEDLLQ